MRRVDNEVSQMPRWTMDAMPRPKDAMPCPHATMDAMPRPKDCMFTLMALYGSRSTRGMMQYGHREENAVWPQGGECSMATGRRMQYGHREDGAIGDMEGHASLRERSRRCRTGSLAASPCYKRGGV